MAGNIVTPTFRLSFPQLFSARAFQNQAPKFSLVMLFPSDADLSAMKAAAAEVAREKFPSGVPAQFRSPFRKGEEKLHLDGYEQGVIFVRATANEENPPTIVDEDRNEILDKRKVYAGCYCRAVVRPFAYDTSGNRGVSFGFSVVQFVRDGSAFGAGGGLDMLDKLPKVAGAGGTSAAPPIGADDDLF